MFSVRLRVTEKQTWSSRDLSLGLKTRFYKSWSWSWSWNPSLGLGLGLGTWDLGPWRLGLRHSWSVKLRQHRKSSDGFVWLYADHPGDDNVKKTVRDAITNAIIFEAEQCCSTAELETASQSAPCEPVSRAPVRQERLILHHWNDADLDCLILMRDIVLRPLQ